MNKRILCLLLCIFMLIGCLAGCSAKGDEEAVEDINEEASESALTLSMYLMSEEPVSAEQADAIETAVNRITKSKFKTQLELSFFTADEYYEKLEASFAARAEAEAAGLIKAPTEEESTEEETYEDEWGVSQIKYPTIEGYQVDIFYMGGYDKFAQYLDMGMLSNLNDELTSASKKLNTYISTPYLSYMKAVNNKSVYAIPTNAAIGEYTYLLINKEALAKTHYDTDAGLKYFTGITDESVQGFLAKVGEYGYTPLYYDNEKLDYVDLASSGMYYWGVDENGSFSNEFSILASEIGDGAEYGKTSSYLLNSNSMGSVANSTRLKKQLDVINTYKQGGYFGTAEQFSKGEVAMAYVKGGAEIPAQYESLYEAVVVENPTITTEDLYANMFAVTNYTTSLSRSMEILTYLNTNEDFRNLLLYGIEDENYELVDSEYEDADGNPYKVVKMLTDTYKMDINKTGNTLIAYSMQGENPALKEYIKQQNNDYTVSLTMGLTLSYNGYIVDMDALKELRTLSATVRAEINSAIEKNEYKVEVPKTDADGNPVVDNDGKPQMVTVTYFDKIVAEGGLLSSKSDAQAVLYAVKSMAQPEDEETPCGLGYLYSQWANAMGIVPEDEE